MLSYNSSNYLFKAVKSVMNQTYKNWELVISDDNSTDESWDIIEYFAAKDNRIKIHRNKERLGIPKNRKVAFEKTTGTIISHLDADDMLFPYTLDIAVSNIPKEVGIAYSDLVWINEQDEIIDYCKNKKPDFRDLGWRHFTFYRRWAYDLTNGYNTLLVSACEDGDLFMQIASKSPCTHIPFVLYKYRCHQKNESKNNKKCETCTERPICNYIRVWAQRNKIDYITFKPLPEEGSQPCSMIASTIPNIIPNTPAASNV